MRAVGQFMEQNFKHFNARETLEAAQAYKELLAGGGTMLLAMAGAMSTGELGISLAEMIRQGKVHAISCTAANLEEDLFNLFSSDCYVPLPCYRDLTPSQEVELRDKGLNRVTDVAIPETVMREVENLLYELWADAARQGISKFPWEFVYDFLDLPRVAEHYKAPPEHSWVLAAKEAGIPIYTPGWEDSTLGNVHVAWVMQGRIKDHSAIKPGTAMMQHLAEWYQERVAAGTPVGFFQIGGGIAGDFAICVVPMLIQDMKLDIPYWAYFCQISDSTTSYGSYSGAVPNEKITWGKLDERTPRFMINSDALLVAPLIFGYVLGW